MENTFESQVDYWAHMLDECSKEQFSSLDERSGQDGYTPIAHPKTRNRANVPIQYMVMADAESPIINDWHTKFVMQNLQLTNSVSDGDEARAFKTTVPERAMEFAQRVIQRYPHSYVILCKNEHSYAPMRRQNCKRFGVVDIYEPGFGWRNGGQMLEEREFYGSETSYADPSDGIVHVRDLLDLIESMEGDLDFIINVCMSSGATPLSDNLSIIGRINGIQNAGEKCQLTLAPYVNGRRRKDCSVTSDQPMMAAEIVKELSRIPDEFPVVVRMKDPLGMGPNANKIIISPVIGGKVTNGAFTGVFIVVDQEQKLPLNERRMVGPAGAAKGLNDGIDEIADFRQKLESGVVEFEFTKADGTKRHAVGTTSEQIVPTSERRKLDPSYDTNLTSYQHRGAYIIWFWDLDKNAVRCFNTNRFEGIVKYEQTSQHVTPDVKKVGDIYLHQDIDDGMMKTFNPEAASQINSQIDTEIASGSGGFSSILVGGGFTNADVDFGDIEIEAGPSNEPILRIEIRKHGSDNDQPYPLKINEMRKYILEKWGVNIKKVIVDGQFEF